MADDFETYARGKIAALRDEADQLERVLAGFLADRGPHSGTSASPFTARLGAPLRREPRRRGNSAFGKVMDAIRAAGPSGLSLDDMAGVAEREGAPIARNTLRSMVWHEKTNGRLIALAAGRYAAPPAQPALEDMLG